MDLDLNYELGVESPHSWNDVLDNGPCEELVEKEEDGLIGSDSENSDFEAGKLAEEYDNYVVNVDGEIGNAEMVGVGTISDLEAANVGEEYCNDANTIHGDTGNGEMGGGGSTVEIPNQLSSHDILNRTYNGSNTVHEDARAAAANNGDNNICDDLEKRLSVGSVMRDLDEAYVLYCEYGHAK